MSKFFGIDPNRGAYNTLRIGISEIVTLTVLLSVPKDEQKLFRCIDYPKNIKHITLQSVVAVPKAIQLLLKKHKKYDKIIFVFSNIDRLYVDRTSNLNILNLKIYPVERNRILMTRFT